MLPIGIDLGTTNSLIAVWKDGRPQLIPNALGQLLTPSAVSIDTDGSVLVGEAARARLVTHPDRSVTAFKRYMGTAHRFTLADQSFSAPELSSLVLRSLKQDAEAFLGQPVQDVVISVPAYFSDEQRKHTRFAAELAGLNAVRLINEPTAAAMAYGLHERGDRRSLIFDLGGGTFDVTLLEYALPVIEVRASTGDNFLGGEDFTEQLLNACLKEWQIPREQVDQDSLARLLGLMESLKQQPLQDKPELQWQWGDRTWSWQLDEMKAVRVWQPLLERLRLPIEQALRDAKLKPSALDSIVLVGGATRLPLVQHLVAALFGRLPHRHLDPDCVVALGAATQAACRARDAAVQEVILTDVCPYSLGISTARKDVTGRYISDLFSPIIERNTVIPVSRVETYHTLHDNQDAIRIEIYQGERPRVQDNIFIEAFQIPVPPAPAGQEAIDVRFSYDIDGLLEVDVTVKSTGEQHSRVIDRSPTGLDARQRAAAHERLAQLKIHPRDELHNRTLLARLEAAYTQLLGDDRTIVANWLENFEMVLARQESATIAQVREQLNQQLKQLGF